MNNNSNLQSWHHHPRNVGAASLTSTQRNIITRHALDEWSPAVTSRPTSMTGYSNTVHIKSTRKITTNQSKQPANWRPCEVQTHSISHLHDDTVGKLEHTFVPPNTDTAASAFVERWFSCRWVRFCVVGGGDVFTMAQATHERRRALREWRLCLEIADKAWLRRRRPADRLIDQLRKSANLSVVFHGGVRPFERARPLNRRAFGHHVGMSSTVVRGDINRKILNFSEHLRLVNAAAVPNSTGPASTTGSRRCWPSTLAAQGGAVSRRRSCGGM